MQGGRGRPNAAIVALEAAIETLPQALLVPLGHRVVHEIAEVAGLPPRATRLLRDFIGDEIVDGFYAVSVFVLANRDKFLGQG